RPYGMRYFKKFPLIAFLIITGVSTLLHAQNTSSAEVDFTFEAYMKGAWETLREADMSDSLQHVYSREFYEYYLQNPKTTTGQDALSQAFTMWGNTGNDTYIAEALKSLDYDSEIWSKIIHSVGSIYYQ